MELQVIQSKIYEVRGTRVMLDRDLAELYQVETKALNRAVKRNIERFPERFMFQLTKEESLRFQSGTLEEVDNNHDLVLQNGISTKKGRGQHFKYLPYAFTEQGVSMLSAVLRSVVAVQVSINIMDAFVVMRNYLTSTSTLSVELSEIRTKLQLLEHSNEDTLEAVNDLSEDMQKEIENIYTAIAELSIKLPKSSKPKTPIGYNIERGKNK